MALEPGPMQVVHNFHSTKEEVLDDIKKLDLWPTVYVSERMEGKSYVLNEKGERVELGAGDKLILPAGAVHAEGEVTERMVYIVGISKPENLFDALLPLLEPDTSPLS